MHLCKHRRPWPLPYLEPWQNKSFSRNRNKGPALMAFMFKRPTFPNGTSTCQPLALSQARVRWPLLMGCQPPRCHWVCWTWIWQWRLGCTWIGEDMLLGMSLFCCNYTSYLRSFTIYGLQWCAKAPLSIIACDTSWQYLVFQSLYRGFPHIRTGHESNSNQGGVGINKRHLGLIFFFQQWEVLLARGRCLWVDSSCYWIWQWVPTVYFWLISHANQEACSQAHLCFDFCASHCSHLSSEPFLQVLFVNMH